MRLVKIAHWLICLQQREIDGANVALNLTRISAFVFFRPFGALRFSSG
jgi:hypothetical protein